MTTNIMGLNINFIHEGSGDNVILLHGWANDISYFDQLFNDLKKQYSVFAIDLPGFGKSELKEVFSTANYSEIILSFIKKFKIAKPTLIGHSFGGKVIIDLVTNQKYNPNKIILIDSSGIKQKKSLYKKYKIYKYKIFKKIINSLYSKERANYLIDDLNKKYASIDYNNSKGNLRGSFVKIVNEDYKDLLYLIKCPTLLIWGEFDSETPLNDARIMNKKINNSGLVIIKNANHFPLTTNYFECKLIIESFLKSI